MATHVCEIFLNGEAILCHRIGIGARSVLLDFRNCHVEIVFDSPLGDFRADMTVVGIETPDGVRGLVIFGCGTRRGVMFRVRRLRPEEEWLVQRDSVTESGNFPFFKETAASESERALRRVDLLGRRPARQPDKKNTLETLHADVQRIKEITDPLPAAIAKLGAGMETVQRHVRGVPILQAELTEARVVPEAAALELHNRIADIMTVEEQAIWREVRNASGIQKDALPSLRRMGVVNSTATLSRRVGEIDKKLHEHGLPPCAAVGPAIQYTKSGGYTNDDGKVVSEELSPVERDWADDPVDRETTIQSYLCAKPEDKAYFHEKNPGIEAEAKKYLKRRSMKSN